LARSREGGATNLLRALTISPDQIRRRVRLLLNDGMTELSLEAAKRTARLSELSRRVLNAAEQLASAENEHQPTRLDHLLLVLAHERRSMSSRILRECGLDLPKLEAVLLNKKDDGLHEAIVEEVIDQAVDRADQLGTHYTGTDHILLALAQNPVGDQLLAQVGVISALLIDALYHHLARR